MGDELRALLVPLEVQYCRDVRGVSRWPLTELQSRLETLDVECKSNANVKIPECGLRSYAATLFLFFAAFSHAGNSTT